MWTAAYSQAGTAPPHAKKFSNTIVGNPAALASFQWEPKAVTNREAAMKRMERVDKSGKRRPKQMTRKPLLQQRVAQLSY